MSICDLTLTESTTELQFLSTKNVRVELRFRDTISSPLDLIIVSEFPKIFHIDRDRKVRVVLQSSVLMIRTFET